jgi:hypothetical protein
MDFEITPDERALRADFADAPFQSQLGRLWGTPRICWPYVFLWIKSRSIAGSSIERYWVRLDCTKYPEWAPTGTFWDMDADCQLANERRPWGTGEVALVFRTDWPDDKNGGHGSAFYTPTDRVALNTHSDWPGKYPATEWAPEKGICHYLNEIARLLDSAEYTGPRGSAA